MQKWLNKKAKFDYEICEKFEAGMVLLGSEVKSLRKGSGSITEAHVGFSDGELVVFNINIAKYSQGFEREHDPLRKRVLLVKKKEKNRLFAAVKKKGQTIIPLEMYWNKRGFLKILCALAVGKNKSDKRQSIKEKEWKREKERAFKKT